MTNLNGTKSQIVLMDVIQRYSLFIEVILRGIIQPHIRY